ncbi:unnamed protein product [Musa acuminata subsp. burmannicoides]
MIIKPNQSARREGLERWVCTYVCYLLGAVHVGADLVRNGDAALAGQLADPPVVDPRQTRSGRLDAPARGAAVLRRPRRRYQRLDPATALLLDWAALKVPHARYKVPVHLGAGYSLAATGCGRQ